MATNRMPFVKLASLIASQIEIPDKVSGAVKKKSLVL